MADKKAIEASELLERVARALKSEIGPAVAEAFPKTQAFMASVVLQKLAGELRHRDRHAAQNRADTLALGDDLEQRIRELDTPPAALVRTLETLRRDLDTASLRHLVEELYAEREALGEEAFHAWLDRVRVVLRARIDRAVEVAA